MSYPQHKDVSKIFLVGMPGCGKSTVGKVLATVLGYQFLDLDTLIEEQEGATVPEVFAQQGQEYFREAEARALRQATANHRNMVLATGGGAPCFCGNMDYMLAEGIPVYLKLSPENLVVRLKEQDLQARPLLRDKTPAELRQYLSDTLSLREVFYKQATYTVPAGDNPPEEVAQGIGRLLIPSNLASGTGSR